MTFEDEGTARVDWRPDGESTETAPQAEFELD